MSQKISLKEAERKVIRTSFDDGLWDVGIGCMLLLTALAVRLRPSMDYLGIAAVILPLQALAMLLTGLVRKFVVRPRIGVAKLRPQRVSMLLKFNFAGLLAGVIAFVIALLLFVRADALPAWLRDGRPALIFGLLAVLPFGIVGFLLGLTRFYAYGVLVGLSPLVDEWLHGAGLGFSTTFGIAAGIVLVAGLVVFLRFLRDNPLPPEDVLSAASPRNSQRKHEDG